MAVDTVAKRAAVAGIPFHVVGPNVTPGTTGVFIGRAAAAWNYGGNTPTPPVVGDTQEKFTLGTEESLGVQGSPSIGGWLGH